MRYKIELHRDGCISCGLCYASDPDHFIANGVGDELSVGIFIDESIENARNAAIGCPVSVITVIET